MRYLRKYKNLMSITATILFAVFILCFPILRQEASFKKTTDLTSHYSVNSFYSNFHAPYSPERVNSFHINPTKIFIDKYVYCPNEISNNLLFDKNSNEIFKRENNPSILEKNCILRI
jgi:hypothetical protein